jgi:hypothetical protein
VARQLQLRAERARVEVQEERGQNGGPGEPGERVVGSQPRSTGTALLRVVYYDARYSTVAASTRRHSSTSLNRERE